jgi:hypothetical protein
MALAIAATAAVLPVPAGAQFFGYRYDNGYGPPPPPPPQQRGFFTFPFFNSPPPQQRAPTESYVAPPPAPPKPGAPPPTSTVVVIGDSMADWLAYGLEDIFATDSPEIAVKREIHPYAGLVHYDPRNDTLDWSAAVKDQLDNDKPTAIVVMLGIADRLPLRERTPPPPHAAGHDQPAPAASASTKPTPPQGSDKQPAAPPPQDAEQSAPTSDQARPGPGGFYDYHTDKWAELYGKRVDEMIAALKSKGVPVLWVGLPALYGAKSTSDMSYLDDIYRARAERAGIVYVDIWDGFVDESGRYVTQGPDFEGQIRRLRTGDGVHFTKYGADKLAQYVVQDLRRIMSNRLVPVALPAPEETPGKSGAGPRPVAGPVLPLSATAAATATDGTDLLGASGRAVPVNADPLVSRVLSRGDAIPTPPGRADDFSWPRHGTDPNGAADAEPAPAVTPPPAAPPAAKKPDDGKSKIKAAPSAAAPSTPPPPVPAPRASLDGAPRPPAPAGGF